jgi:nitrate/nitrite transport system permease protein
MAEKTADKIKYRILKFLDVTGFAVFDPIVRLAFREEPKKQMEAISKYLIIPIIFVTLCVGLWWKVAPN